MIINSTNSLPSPPQRIISLVPSQTSFLHALGLDKKVIGITKFCSEPEQWRKEKIKIGGTKNPNIIKIKNLRPDLIIANKEENRKEDVDLLAMDFPVWLTDVHDLTSALDMMIDLGELTGKEKEAKGIMDNIKMGFQKIGEIKLQKEILTAYFIWKDPWMTVGGDTFIHDIMQRAGFKNIFGDSVRYPIVDITTLKEKKCELIMLSSEPYPFREKHVLELSQQLPLCRIELIDGMKFSWYGDQLLHTPDYLSGLIPNFSIK